jgi:hypothetical protein
MISRISPYVGYSFDASRDYFSQNPQHKIQMPGEDAPEIVY